MATLVLGAAASAFAGSIGAGPIVSSLLSGVAAIGGAYADSLISARFAPTQKSSVSGSKIGDLRLQTSTEGAPMSECYGRVRLAGQVIWATRLKMEVTTTTERTGGKGGGGGGTEVTTTTYSYFANFAVGLCEGEISGIGRVWADGKILDLSGKTHRIYPGRDDQQPDPFIETKEGAAPAYRGTAYVVFEDLHLEQFGNRIPQLEFEVFRPLNGVEKTVPGLTIIPGAGEWVYANEEIRTSGGGAEGETATENVNNQVGGPDWAVAIDNLERTCPNAKSVLLVASWFGNDLRCGSCQIRPGVEYASGKSNTPHSWQVHGLSRSAAYEVTRDPDNADRPVYGGTPADISLVQAIRDLKARGIGVVFYPFILMDIPQANGLADPYGGAEQAVLPWRGRITCHPAAGQPGTVDKTAAAASQVSAFFGAAAASDISVSVNASTNAVSVSYGGPAEWGLRRMTLHYAKLCAAINAADPGAVSGFVIGSELRGLTTIRTAQSSYPAVAELVTLAADCKTVLGASVDITYAADWSEYRGHDPADGSGDFHFHLDPLWSSPSVDAVAIDNYMKMSDWRDGIEHADALAGWRSIYDPAYLQANIEGGEDYDWYYASGNDRDSQTRTPITDGAGKPWVFRAKDIRSWWLNQHVDRPGGVETGSPTAWAPQSKPVWFTEYGFPSVDKATNQPNVFVDPKSSESAWPYYSNEQRDDFIQRRAVEALLGYWDPANGRNPVSGVYGGNMLDLSRSFLWTWDARPFPAWPNRSDLWGDAPNWAYGHWVEGKFGALALDELVEDICAAVGFTDVDATLLAGTVTGWLRTGIASPRDQLDILGQIYRFDAVETGGVIRFVPRGLAPTASLAEADLAVPDRRSADWQLTRGQETDLPLRASLGFWDAAQSYRQTTANAGRLVTTSARVESVSAPLVMETGEAEAIAESWLLERWAEREQAQFALPPSKLAVDATDAVELTIGGRKRELRLTRIVDGGVRQCEAVVVEPSVYELRQGTARQAAEEAVVSYGEAVLAILDLPVLNDKQGDYQPWLAAYAGPWGGVRVLEGSRLVGALLAPATLGRTLADFYRGTAFRFDRANTLTVELSHGGFASAEEEALLEGRTNALAIQNPDGDWEILQFAMAELTGERTWVLSALLRGRNGTEHAMRDPVPAGARVVLLDEALVQADVPLSDRGIPRSWSFGPAPLPSTASSFKTVSNTLQTVALKPFAPVHLRGKRDPAGDLSISWIRRTRKNGTWADGTDVPLSEAVEAYELEIVSAGSVIRTASGLATPFFTYTAADQVADFGSLQPVVTVRVFQLSEVAGRGIATEQTL